MYFFEEYILSKDEIEINDRCVKIVEVVVKIFICSKLLS